MDHLVGSDLCLAALRGARADKLVMALEQLSERLRTEIRSRCRHVSSGSLMTRSYVVAAVTEATWAVAVSLARAEGWRTVSATFTRHVGSRNYEVQVQVSR